MQDKEERGNRKEEIGKDGGRMSEVGDKGKKTKVGCRMSESKGKEERTENCK